MTGAAKLYPIDYIVLVSYFIIVLGIGLWVSFRKRHSEDLFLGGRQIRWLNVGFSIFGTNVTPSMLVASCEAAYSKGMVPANFEWLAWPFLMLLAMVFAPHYLNTRITTMPEFLERRFSHGCRTFLSYYSLAGTIIIHLGGVLLAGGILIAQMTDWPYLYCVIGLTIVALSFTATGGLNAVAVTDTFQSILMIVGSAILTIIVFNQTGGVDQIASKTPDIYWKLFRPFDDPDYSWPAILLGYPVLGIWFWCTDQAIVQRVLGARDLKHGQAGAILAAFLKILTPVIFFLPGIFLFAINPNLEPKAAYITLVRNYLPAGMIGMIYSILIASLVASLAAGLNSFATVFTLDIYVRKLRPGTDPTEFKRIGQYATLAAGGVAAGAALLMNLLESSLFDILQHLIAIMAPPMAAVFIVGVLWKRANRQGALFTLVFGSIICVIVGILSFRKEFPSPDFWHHWYTHFMIVCFYLFVLLVVTMIIVSLLTPPPPKEKDLPTLRDTYAAEGSKNSKMIWGLWGVVAVIMVAIYMVFN